jgi:uncharacterized protein YkwD
VFDLVVRRVAALAAAPALFALSAPALAHGPITPPRPQGSPSPPAVTTAPPQATPAPPKPAPPKPAPPKPVAPVGKAAPTATTTPTLSPVQIRARAVMVQVVRLTNDERKDAGCPALAVDGQLVTASLRQSNYMARTRLFSHVWRDGSTFVDRSEAAGYQQPAGENIAWGYRTAPEVMNAWMASPGHRKNILNCKAKSFGAGVAFAADGTPYYTQVFGWE